MGTESKLSREEVIRRYELVRRHGRISTAALAENIDASSLSRAFHRAIRDFGMEDFRGPNKQARVTGRVHQTPGERQDAEFWRRKYRTLEGEAARLRVALREVSGLMERRPEVPTWIATAPHGAVRRRAVGLLHLSDAHVGEVVRAEQISGLNAYDPDIFVARLSRAVSATCDILPRWAADCDLRGIVCALNGDLISGDIHDELRRTNALTSHEQVYHATDHLAAAIARLADAFGRVFVPVTPGNHGRTTEKTHAKNVGLLSYDTLIGEGLRRHFRDDRRVTVQIATGPDIEYPILGWRVMQSHGDALGTGGGRGFAGPILPIARGVHQVQRQAHRVRRSHDIILTAHYHTAASPAHGVLANGSIVGYSEFAHRIRADYDVPRQWLALVHERWCIRERLDLALEDPDPPAPVRVPVPREMA